MFDVQASPLAVLLSLQGAAYVFMQDIKTFKWTFKQKLYAQRPRALEVFGSSVAMNEYFLVVGVPGRSPFGLGLSVRVTLLHRPLELMPAPLTLSRCTASELTALSSSRRAASTSL
jgi:hypothetical protein